MIPKWLLKRIFFIIPSLLGVSIIVFFISANVPGDPVYALVGERADPELINLYRSKLGLDKNIVLRYFNYLKMLLTFDLGTSYYTGNTIKEELLSKFPNTIYLASASMLFSIIFGISLGVIAAFLKNSIIDKIIIFISTTLISLPVFWFGMLLIYIFSYKFKLLPVSGMDSHFSIVLPAITLGSRSLGYLVRLTKSTMCEVLNSEYIITVKAKGGGQFLIFKHAIINAIIPIITFIGLDFGSYLNGSVLTETIFGWDGIGRFAINGIFRRDYPVIIGTVIFGAFIFMLINIFIDILYVFIDPKLRRQGL